MSTANQTLCPDATILKEYVSGALDETAASAFGHHLEHCSRCQQRVDEQILVQDSLTDALRHPQPTVPPSDKTRLDELIDRAQRTATSEPAPAPEPVALYVFVACLRKSGLLNPSEVDLLIEVNRPTSSESFAKLLVARGKLTPFQARVLARGRWRGLVLGNYVVLEKLGQGGMGTVFKARHRHMSRVVCLKVLHPSHRKSPGILERFRREAQTVAALKHPNIVVAHDAGESDGIPFLVMEFVQGSDLAQRVAKHGPLKADAAIDVVLQTARALDHAHRQGVIHRDIKPHNLLIDEAGAVKILDMGLARFDSYFGDNPDATTHASMTGSGIIVGTVDYMAPEQALNSRCADKRSDIYSLGCTLHFLLTGKVLYAGETVMEKLIAHREQPAPSLRDRIPGVSKGLDAVFRQMIAKAPADRYGSMTELIQDLEALQSGRRPTALARLHPSSPIRWLRRAAIAAAMLAIAAVIIVNLSNTPSVQPPPQSPKQVVEKDVKKVGPAPPPQLVGHPQTRANGGPGRAMVVLSHDWFIEDHYTTMEQALKSQGITFAVASSKPGQANPKHNWIPAVPVDLTLDKFDVHDFDAVVFLGGNYYEFTDRNKPNGERVKRIVTECLNKGKPVAAVDIGIMVLDEAGFTGECNFEQKGGCWIGSSPNHPGLLITTKDHKYLGELTRAIFTPKEVDGKQPK